MRNWVLYIAAFASAFAITLLTTPLAKKISIKLGAIDYPKARGMHTKPMPRMGGIAIVLGFMVTVLMLFPFVTGIEIKEFVGLVIGSLIIVVLGIVDDIHNLRARVKLFAQILAALIVVLSGIRINVVFWPFTAALEKLSIPLTMIWIIGVTNAVNLIDGLDGLAAGVSSIAALSLMVLCILTGSEEAVMLTAAIAGSCLGFLPRNFNPAEIFMGDTGATFLGFVLSVASIIGVFKGYAVFAVIVAILCLGLPVFDTMFAMIRRIIRHKPIMQADRGHLHHRLIDRGYSQKQAVIILYGISISCGLVAILIALRDIKVFIVLIATIVVLSLFIWAFNYYNKKNE
ncbi:MAG: MraY family glycosyltransferase [Lachnospiraceae bacterium]|nr:MraY family glycosyltransferase [Lachnospiraceae bacterium]